MSRVLIGGALLAVMGALFASSALTSRDPVAPADAESPSPRRLAYLYFPNGVADGAWDPWATRHATRFAVGLVMMLIVALMPPRFWMAMSYPAYLGALALLLGVEFFGLTIQGSQRWLELGPIRVQPSEVMKIAVVMALARFYHDLPREKVSGPTGVLVPLALIGMPAVLILHQPDLGTALLVVATGTVLVFLSGLNWKIIGAAVVAAAVAIPLALRYGLQDYQRERIFTFLNPVRVGDYVYGTSGQSATIRMESSSFDPYLKVLRNGQFSARNDDFGGSRSVSQVEVSGAGTYTVLAGAFSAINNTGGYTLAVTAARQNTPVPNASGDGSTVQGTISDSDTRVALTASDALRLADAYSVSLQAGQTLIATMESSAFDTYLKLMRGGEFVARNDDAGSTSRSEIRHVASASGTYTLYAGTEPIDILVSHDLGKAIGALHDALPGPTHGYVAVPLQEAHQAGDPIQVGLLFG